MTIALDLFAGLIDSSGVRIGYMMNGYLYIPYAGGGIIMQDSTGVLWLLQINTDGSLSASSITL